MKKTVLILIGLLVSSIILSTFPQIVTVKGQAKTIIIVPDDYPTIHEAIGNASDGDIIYVKKGTYDGPINQTLIINKTISLIGEDPETTILNLHPNWVFKGWESPMIPVYGYDYSIKIQASDVELSGFTFTGQGTFWVEGRNTQINNNVIKLNMWLAGSNGNLSQNNMSITISVGGSRNTVSKNIFIGEAIDVRFGSNHSVYNNICSGIGVMASNCKIFNNIIKNGSSGVALVLPYSTGNSVYGNIITNSQYGLVIYMDGTNNTIYENYVTNNTVGINFRVYYVGKENTSIYHNNFVNNTKEVQVDRLWADVSYGTCYFDNGEGGNYWSNYNGTDNDGDGIGDTPFIIDEDRQDNMPLVSPVEIEPISIPEFPVELNSPFEENTFNVEHEQQVYVVRIYSNSTISKFYFDVNLKRFRFNVDGNVGTTGVCNITIPAELMSGEFLIYKDGTQIIKNTDYTQAFNYTHYSFKITYKHFNHMLIVSATNAIPEFPSWIVLPLFLVTTLAIIQLRKKIKKPNS